MYERWKRAQERYRNAPPGERLARLKDLRRLTVSLLRAEVASREVRVWEAANAH